MRRKIRLTLLHLLKLAGMFSLARYLTRNRIRILGYHGISSGDEHLCQPYLFMRPEVFERRMRKLAGGKWRIVDLDDAVAELKSGQIVNDTVVVTIDDGWKSTLTHATPLLRKLEIPATVYITTYYCERPVEIFNVTMFYMLWKARRPRIELRSGHADLDGTYDFGKGYDEAGLRWLEYCNANLDWQGRQAFLGSVAQALGLDLAEVVRGDRFRNLTPEQVRELSDLGMRVELHTHRHRLPSDPREVKREIDDNRTRLEAWTGKTCRHFCYPSGQYDPSHPQWLGSQRVVSATTCDHGLGKAGDNPLLLPRILDRDDWAEIEFDAAMCGVFDVVRSSTQRLRGGASAAAAHMALALAMPLVDNFTSAVPPIFC